MKRHRACESGGRSGPGPISVSGRGAWVWATFIASFEASITHRIANAGMSFEMIYAFVEDLRERTDIDFCARGVAPATRSSLLAVARSAFFLVTRFGSICGARAREGKSGSSWARALLGKAPMCYHRHSTNAQERSGGGV